LLKPLKEGRLLDELVKPVAEIRLGQVRVSNRDRFVMKWEKGKLEIGN